MNELPEHLRERIFEEYCLLIEKRCSALVTGLDHCGLLETCQDCRKLRQQWLELRKEMLGFKAPSSMGGLISWMADIDKRARRFASWLEKKHIKYFIHYEQASFGNTTLATSPSFAGNILSIYVINFARGNRTRKDMDAFALKLPQNTKIRLFTSTQHGACVLFLKFLNRLPQTLQSLDCETFPKKNDLRMFTCAESQAAIARAIGL